MHETVYGVESNIVTVTRSLVANGEDGVCLTGTWRSNENEVIEAVNPVISSLAQEESRSISENATWGQRKRMQDGKISLPYGQFPGYEKGEDSLPKIVAAEAEIVRLIYKMYLNGKTVTAIAKYLTEQGVPTPAGKQKWNVSVIQSILSSAARRSGIPPANTGAPYGSATTATRTRVPSVAIRST